MILRQVGPYRLNKGTLMADGLFNFTNEDEIYNTDDKGVSLWFDGREKDIYMDLSDEDFVDTAQHLIREGNKHNYENI